MQRVKMRLTLVLACALLSGLAACGGGSSGSNGTGSSSAPKEISGTITVWDTTFKALPQYTKAAEQLDAEFEQQHPGVTVKHVAQPFAQYDQTLQAAFTGRRGPDVMALIPGNRGLRWSKGLVKLNDRITPDMRDRLSGWELVSADYDPSGDVYMVPQGVQGYAFYYNKKLFAKAGLPTDFQPQTWDEVKAAGEKLKAAGIQPFTGGDKEGYENEWWFGVGWAGSQTREDAVALVRGQTPFTDPSVADAWAPEIAMQKAGLFEQDRYTTPLFPDGAARFGEGKAGMFLGVTSGIAYYGDYNPKLGEKNVGVFMPPGKGLFYAPAQGWAIPSFAKNKEAAWAYIQFVTSHLGIQTFYKVSGVLPNDKSVAISATAPPQERAIIEAIRRAGAPTIADLPAAVTTALRTEINEVLQGRKSMQAAQEALQAVAEQSRR